LTLQDKLAAARTRLVGAGIAEAEAALDVDLYARTILGWDRAKLVVHALEPAPASLEPRFSEWVERRERREPTAYIIGSREFWGLDFIVTPAVLIPRPETEFIVEEAIARMSHTGDSSPRVADIGTGSGCVAVSLAHEAQCRVIATDISADALAVARLNAARHGVSGRVELVHTSYLEAVHGQFDLIVANPPYVREGDKPALSRDVRHEPDVALFGGASGLRDIDAVLAAAASKLKPRGWFVMEFGYGQEDDVRALLSQRPELRLERVREDLQGIPRTVVIQRER
jgi:release factor glutamine methyltransferase